MTNGSDPGYDFIPLPASGWCSSCGTRVEESWNVRLYDVPNVADVLFVAPEAKEKVTYLLCGHCDELTKTGSNELVMSAVAERIAQARRIRNA